MSEHSISEPHTRTPASAEHSTQAITEVPTLPETTGDAPRAKDETGALSLEIVSLGLDNGALAVNGIRRSITERRLKSAEKKIKATDFTAEVHSRAATAIKQQKGIPNSRRPISREERRRYYKADKRQRRIDVIRSQDLSNMRLSYGQDIGTPAF